MAACSDTGRNACSVAAADDLGDHRLHSRMRRAFGMAHSERKISRTDHHRVQPRHCEHGIKMRQQRRILELRDHQRLAVGGLEVGRCIGAVGHVARCARNTHTSFAKRRVLHRVHQHSHLGCIHEPGHHHAHHAGVEVLQHELGILRPDAHQRRDAGALAGAHHVHGLRGIDQAVLCIKKVVIEARNAAELCAKEMNITREAQDAFAIDSYKKTAVAHGEGQFKDEIAAVEIPQRGKDSIFVTDDEEFSKVKFDKIPGLKPVFDKAGTVTAANASSLNDGASALVLVSGKKMKELGLKPLAKIIGFADAQQAPEWFTTAPAKAIPMALERAGKKVSDVDFFEINEAFAVVSLANNQLLNLDAAKVNVFGGAVALGHPLGNSGARILVTLINVLNKKGASIGAAGICNGGGGASAIVIEKV